MPFYFSVQMTFAEFVKNLRTLNLKKKGQRPKMNPNKFYPSQAELQTQEVMREELNNYADKLEKAASTGDVAKVYAVPGAVPDGFREVVEGLAEKVSEFQMRSFAQFSELTVGERYFPSQENKEQILNTWTENFVNQCKSTNEEMRKKVAGVVSDGVLEGRRLNDITKEIKKTCSDFTDNKAELIATTEIGKLNTAIEKAQMESAGIEYYQWSAAMDGRTRDSHAVMDGKICKWGDDKSYYEWSPHDPKTGKKKLIRKDRPKNAYIGAPGTDFRCRCTALPYVPEFEDDYEEERENRPIQGVTQGAYSDPTTILRNNELEAQRKIRETPKRKSEIEAKANEKKAKVNMLYRMADKLQGAKRDAYILRRTADRQNYLADVLEYPLPEGKERKRMLDAFKNYCRPEGSEKINKYLVKHKERNPGLEGNIKAMEDWIRRNPLPENKVLYRAIPLSKGEIDEILKKKRVVGKGGFQSLSSSLEHSASFIDSGKYGVILKINGKKGDKVAPPLRIEDNKMVGYSEEQEYDALPSATFKVKKSYWDGKICYIDCEFEE